MKEHDTKQKNLKSQLFERIETENVCPRSKMFYKGRECFVWSLWLLSVLVGALAVAVSLFVVAHHQYALYEATHENAFTYLVEVLPYLWITIFGLMVYVAIYNLRHTARGYRHPVWVILLSSVVLSFAGGSVLNMLGLGYEVDEILGQHMRAYTSQQKLEYRMWQEPIEGRLVGRQVYSTLAPTTTVIFEDVEGKRWRMNVSELQPRDLDLLHSGKVVRLIGKKVGDGAPNFHACGSFPVMLEPDTSLIELMEERQEFVDRIQAHANKKGITLTQAKMGAPLSSTTVAYESVCATISPVRRMAPAGG